MIRWIRGNLGTAAFDKLPTGDYEVVDVRGLVDRRGNSVEYLMRHVSDAVELLRMKKRVVIACDAGISRSNVIAAGAIARIDNISLDQALTEVVGATGENEIKIDVIQTMRTAFDEKGPTRRADSIMVTGATGFIGANLVAALRKNGMKIFAPARDALAMDSSSSAFLSAMRSEGVSKVIHLAYPRRFTDTSSIGEHLTSVFRLLEACSASESHLYYVSGAVVFHGAGKANLVAEETTAPNSAGIYGDTKLSAEELVKRWRGRGDVSASIIRLASVYGPGSDRPKFLKAFLQKILQSEPIVTHRFRNGQPALDLLYVEDAVEGLVRAILFDDPFDVHFGCGELVTTQTIAKLIAEICGRHAQLLEHLIDDDLTNVAFAADLARERLAWSPTWTLRAGITSIIKNFCL